VVVSVQYIANGTAGLIYFGNVDTGDHFSITLSPPNGATMSGNTIEWIMEAPNFGLLQVMLPSFTPVNFTDAVGCAGDRGAIGNAKDADIFDMSVTFTRSQVAAAAVTIQFAE